MKNLILNITLLLLLSSCLSTDVVEIEIPHEEYIVVQGILKKNSFFDGVRFAKTLSLSEPYNIKSAELTEVTAYLLIDETITIPLHYKSEGLYLPLYPHRVIGGASYELFARYLDTKIYSNTIVPDTIIAIKSKLLNSGFIQSTVKANTNFVYGAIWEVYQSGTPITASDFYSIVPDEENRNNNINVRTELIPQEFINSTLYTRVYAFDKFYRKHFQSKGSNKSDSLFSNVTSPNWNIRSTDTKVIGLFIGMDESKPIKVEN